MFLKKLKIELAYDSVTSLLDMHPKELISGCQRDIRTPMFVEALFIIAKIGKQSKFTPTDEWINCLIYIH